jgi:hypothetical protein
MFMKQPLIATVLGIVMLGGCASTAPSNEGLNYSAYYGKTPVYAKLEKTVSGDYYFSSIHSKAEKTGEFVRLNDLVPQWNTKDETGCWLGMGFSGNIRRINCKSMSPEKFRVDNMDVAQSIFKGVMTVATYGIAGTARQTNVKFDKEAYLTAVNKALAKSGLNHKEIIDTVDKTSNKQTLMISEYDNYRNTKLTFATKIKDLSGLFDETPSQLKQNIKIETLPKNTKFIDFELNVKEAHRLSILLGDATKTKLAPLLSKISMQCFDRSSLYNLNIECPEEIDVKSIEQTIILPVTITGKNIDSLLPRVFDGSDNNLFTNINNDSFKFENASDKFLSIKSISVYYKGQISTETVDMLMPPKSLKSLPLGNFLSKLPTAKRAGYTKAKAQKEQVSFGFAIKYELADDQLSTSLYKNETFTGTQLL